MLALRDYEEIAVVSRVALTLPLSLPLPDGFEAARLETWPKVEGRLELVASDGLSGREARLGNELLDGGDKAVGLRNGTLRVRGRDRRDTE